MRLYVCESDVEMAFFMASGESRSASSLDAFFFVWATILFSGLGFRFWEHLGALGARLLRMDVAVCSS